MDCQMPVMDGYTATRRIRAIDPLTPIIAVTANTMPGDHKLSLAAGMNGHLGKPIEREELTTVLQQWLPKSA
jgi:CheY-like chemotaxis protein